MSELTELYLKEFHDPDTRYIYADNFLNTYIATQIKVLREDRDWTQSKLAEQAGMKQERISVLENVNYESWSVKTLKRLAKAFDLRLSIKFESFGSYLTDYDSFNRENLKRPSFDQDPIFHPVKVPSLTSTYVAPATFQSVAATLLPEIDVAARWGVVPGNYVFGGSIPVYHTTIPSALDEIVAAAVGIVASEKEEAAMPTSITGFVKPESSNTNIIDYSALEPAA